MLTFGLGLTIPEHETESCRNLTRSAWVACGLTNDLFSWEKEYTAATEFGHKNIANAVWVCIVS